MKRIRSTVAFRVYLVVVLVVLALPVLTMMLLSFNASRYGTLPFEFSLEWYQKLSSDSSLLESLRVSISLASQVTVVCVVIGTLLTFGLHRARALISVPVNGMLVAMLTVPALILSAGMVEAFSWLGMGKSETTLVLASVVTTLPFVVLIESGRLNALPDDYAEAARTLGAGPVRRFLTVTAPLMAPSIVAGALLAFVMCFNNFAIQLFLAPFGLSTLPVQIYSMVRMGISPDVNALGTLIVVATVILIVVLGAITGNAARLFISTSQAKEN